MSYEETFFFEAMILRFVTKKNVDNDSQMYVRM